MERKYLHMWLRNAYAMEKSAIQILDKQSDRLGDYPMVQSKMQDHLEETRWQAQQIETCLKSLDSGPSGIKDVMAQMTGFVTGMSNAITEDQPVKDMIAAFTFENMEIASYRSLSATAQECGEYRIRMVCEEILQQELSMAKWCEANIISVTQEFLSAHHAVAR